MIRSLMTETLIYLPRPSSYKAGRRRRGRHGRVVKSFVGATAHRPPDDHSASSKASSLSDSERYVSIVIKMLSVCKLIAASFTVVVHEWLHDETYMSK